MLDVPRWKVGPCWSTGKFYGSY